MFKLSEKYQIDRRNLKCDCFRYSLSDISTIKTVKSQTYIDIPRGDSIKSLFESLLRMTFDVLDSATIDRYKDGDDVRSVNLGPIVSFSFYKKTIICGKHLEEITHAHNASLMYKLINSARNTDDLCFGFDGVRKRRQRQLTNNKKKQISCAIFVESCFWLCWTSKKATFGLGYNPILTRKSDNAVLNEGNTVNNAKIKINSIPWYVPHYKPSVEQQNILMNQIVRKMATELE